jgi:hypothetical protein
MTIESPQSFVVREECQKAASQNGFRRVLGEEAGWAAFGSTTAQGTVHLGASGPQGPWFLELDHPGVIQELSAPQATVSGPGLARFAFDKLGTLYTVLHRVYELSVSLPDAPLREFERRIADLPRTTEAERLVVQRIGQDIFRDRLMDYWGGRCPLAEIAALMTLSSARRVLIVTPLRALSAQTERSFRKTFAPLGFSVSSLYGASGLSAGDEDALRSREIIIATPEKLDFALRSDPSLIDDVGLIVLDEGHMIGPSEREIRYETLVQRLLRRADAGERRIVCLSAILPSGDELDDLTAWIRSDEPGEPVRSDWRPTRQRFGALTWRGKDALLRLDLDEAGPFLDKFVVEKAALGKEKKPYPRKNSHLALFAAWEFASQGKRTLIFSTQANWVESYGKQVVDLCRRGYLDSLLEDGAAIARALEIGKEWLGEDHPAVACLKAGVAIHHGRLPSPFLRELEALLSEGVLKVIVASPTLSQGLNLNAAVLLVPALYRASEKIKGEEFANVAGRAGRAFVDVEGLIVHVMFDKIEWRKKEWRTLIFQQLVPCDVSRIYTRDRMVHQHPCIQFGNAGRRGNGAVCLAQFVAPFRQHGTIFLLLDEMAVGTVGRE